MKFKIKHDIQGRLRVQFVQSRMTFEQADEIQYYMEQNVQITSVKVQERTQCVTICYKGDRESVIESLKAFHYGEVTLPETYLKMCIRDRIIRISNIVRFRINVFETL